MDTMTLTKVTGALCGSLLVFLLGKWAAEVLYYVESPDVAGYVIEIEGDDGGEEEEVVQVSFDELMAAADIEKGARAYRSCVACHKLDDGVNITGPYLYGIVDRPIGSAVGFDFSTAMADKGGNWTPESLYAFLENPRAYIPGNTMSFSGMRRQTDRINLIAYLDSLDG